MELDGVREFSGEVGEGGEECLTLSWNPGPWWNLFKDGKRLTNLSLNSRQLLFIHFNSILRTRLSLSFHFAAAEIIMYEGHVVTYRPMVDLILYAVGLPDGNELMLASVMNGFAEALGILLRGQVEKRTVLEALDLTMLCLDETVDDGYVSHERAHER